MAISLEQFQEQLTTSGLMTASEIDTFVESLGKDQPPPNAEALAKLLVEKKQLTPFQAQQIWKGKGKHLVLGNYVIVEKLGQGGMGMVLKATHRLMKRDVALKVLSPAAVKDEMAVQRFLREVEAAAKLTHPNIVAAHDADQANGNYFLIMEYVEGRDLSQIVKKQGPARIEQAIDCILQAARGLEYAHQHGVIHRDIKPANLLLDKSGTVKVLDMGLARIEEDNVDAATQAGLTGTGTIMGTIDYMAPEQAEDTRSAGPQADIYSLGASLYYLLTGKPMVKGDSLGKKLKMLMTGVGLPDSICTLRKEVPPDLDAIFKMMTAFETSGRYQTMTAVIADLESLKSGGVPSSASTPGIQPVAGRSDDSAMQSFLNKLDDGTVATGPTVMASPKTEVGAETMSSSVDEATRPALKKTAAFTRTVIESKNRKVLIGGGVAACLLVGTIIWGVSGGTKTPTPKSPDDNFANGGSLPTGNATKPESPATGSRQPKWALEFRNKSRIRLPQLELNANDFFCIEAYVTIDRDEGTSLFRILDFRLNPNPRGWRTGRTVVGNKSVQLRADDIPISLKKRQHIALVHDYQQLRLYVDGVLQARETVRDEFTETAGTNEIGEHFEGRIDEFRISRSPRYTKPFVPPATFEADKQALVVYHIDEGLGTVLHDATGNGYDGTIVEPRWVTFGESSTSTPPLAITPFNESQARAHQEEPGAAKKQFRIRQITGEGPQHPVRITKPFYLGTYEVTDSQWQSVMGNSTSNSSNPKSMVSWDDIQPFLAKLNEGAASAGMKFALPTEAQWEYACRAGTTTLYCSGDSKDDLRQYAWVIENSRDKIHPVGELKGNAFDLYDMHGNVAEWCADFCCVRYDKDVLIQDPIGATEGSRRVIRGGSFPVAPYYSASRNSHMPDRRERNIGFRVAMTIDTAKRSASTKP